MNNGNDLKLVELGIWLQMLITHSEKFSFGPVCAVSFAQFESMTTCLSSRIPLKEIIEFEYNEAKDNPVTPC